MTWFNVAVIGGSALLGAGSSIYAGNKAAGATKKATNAAANAQLSMYAQSRADAAPYRDVSYGALSDLSTLMGWAPPTAPGGSYPYSNMFAGGPINQGGGSGYNKFSPLPGGGLGLDPLGDKLFGGSTRREWGGQNLLTGKQVYKLAKQGMSVEDIGKLGLLQSSLNVDAINNLRRAGLSPDDIAMLQRGPQPDPAAAPAASETRAPSMERFFSSPDYNFRLDQQNKTLANSYAARGGVLSGPGVAAALERSGNLASGEFNNYRNALFSAAGLNPINATMAANQQTGGTLANIYTNEGAQRASTYGSTAQGVNNAIQGGLQNWAFLNYLNKMPIKT